MAEVRRNVLEILSALKSKGAGLDTGASGAMALQALDAQAALLPYALALFGIALPIFAWAGSYADNRVWLTATLLIFAINWTVFYGLVDAFKRRPHDRANVGLRARVQILAGLMWAAAVAQVSILGLGAGSAREAIELVAVGGAVACIFFTAPYLPSLLIIGPAAGIPPVLCLILADDSQPMGHIAMAAVALVLALTLIFNRLLRRQFALAGERETLIEERARSLARAEALARSKSDLVATLSDEIRNGLTGVAHVLNAAANPGARSGPSREQMAAALASAEDLIAALNATLDTEAAEAGRLVVEPHPFDATRLIREIVLAYRPVAAAKGLELSCHIEDGLAAGGAAVGDPARVRQIMAALVANAIKYTLRGRVEIRADRLGEARLRLEVADTGPGLAPAEIEQAFEPFKRVARTAAGVSGAGLGLSLSRRLAEMMDGVITVDSALGVGCCFRFDLPFDSAGLLPEAGPAVQSAAKPGEPSPRGLRILAADDDALSAAMLRQVLEQLGHQVLQAGDGRRTYELAQICDVDLIMLSARLPVMDGPEVVQAVRALERQNGRAPIITLIDGDAEEAKACLRAGANGILRRPVSVSSVARAIAKALREDQPAPPKLARIA